jgi:hypothetical protein
MIEEVWQMLAKPANINSTSESDDDELMALSDQAVKGISAAHTLKLHAFIQHKESFILVDSRSSHNFISAQLASQLQPWTPMPHLMRVKVVDGAMLSCTHEIVNCSWSAQGVLFTTTFKILPL